MNSFDTSLKGPKLDHRIDQGRSARRASPPVALTFLYRLVRRVFELVRIHRMGAVARDAEILVLCHQPILLWHRALVRRRRT